MVSFFDTYIGFDILIFVSQILYILIFVLQFEMRDDDLLTYLSFSFILFCYIICVCVNVCMCVSGWVLHII